MIADPVFGNLLELDQRLARHLGDLIGVKHRHQIEPADPVPGQPIRLAVSTSGPVAFAAVDCWYTTEAPGAFRSMTEPEAERRLRLMPDGADWDEVEWRYVCRWTAWLPPQPAGTMLRYRLAGRQAGSETWVYADNQATTAEKATEFAIWVDSGTVPAWSRSAMVYHIFIDRFYPGDGRAWLKPESLSGFFGGTLRGVIQKLDYVAGLGFNTIWLSPLFASPSHHGYDASDYYTVEPRLGTNADLRELIDGAHARGLRVLLDFVANHWSSEHPTFQSARTDPASPYRDWYIWKHWPDDYETYFGVKELPQLNLRRGPARNYLLEAAQYWLKQGADGFRLDYAAGPPHDFWSDFYRACRTTRPDCWLFGEVINSASLLRSYTGRLDGTLDFHLNRALRQTFATGGWTLAEFEAFLQAHEAFFPAGFSRPAFLDNHDMNRFVFLAGGDQARLRLGALVLFALSGPPIVYYGTEAGLSQERPIHQNDFGIFEEVRLPMDWSGATGPGQPLPDYFRRLALLRQAHPALQTGTRRLLHLDAAAGTYAFMREGDADQAAVVVNLSAAPVSLAVPVRGFNPDAWDRLNDSPVRVSSKSVEVDLPAWSGALLS